jgi:predicted nucleic acid-binding protein
LSSAESSPILVFDAMCLNHFSRAERLDVLRDLLLGTTCLTTHVVREEIRAGVQTHPVLQGVLDTDWLGVARLDLLDEIRCFAKWVQRIGSSERNLGEASVFSAAELSHGIAITDDREAVAVGRAYGLEVHGTVWLLARACRDGKLNEVAAGNILDALSVTGMRLPCSGSTFGSYARRNGIT